MKDLFQSTAQIQDHLTKSGIGSAVIGGLAVAFWGEPRLTRDVDLKVLLKREESHNLISLLKPRYICLAQEPEKTLREVGFLFVRAAGGPRIDLLLADTAFDEEAVQRAKPIVVGPSCSITICSAEDLLIYKMISIRARDREDVQGIITRQKERLDDGYILNWLGQFETALDDSTLVTDYRRMRNL